MKRNIILMMLFAVASSMYADIVLKSDKSIRIIPNTLTTSGKTIVYSYDYSDGEITVYTPDFLVDKIIKVPHQEYQSGNFEETATVEATGVDIVPENIYGSKYYYTYSWGEANSQDEMIQKLQDSYYNSATAFTDPLGNPACYIERYAQFMYESLFGKKYPQQWYALIDGTIYEIYTSREFYAITYNEDDAVWTRTSEDIGTYNVKFSSMRIYFEGQDSRKDVYLTQNIFNNDDKWEYLLPNYGNLETSYSYESPVVNDDGTVTLERSGQISPERLGYNVYNEDGQKLGNIPDYDIEFINGKPYIEGSFYDDSGKYYSALYSFDPNSETIDLVEMVQAKENRRLGAKRGIVTVDISAEQAGGEVIVSTTDGKVMASRRVSMGKTQVNDKPLPPGVYVVSLLKNNRVVESEKYIVQ